MVYNFQLNAISLILGYYCQMCRLLISLKIKFLRNLVKSRFREAWVRGYQSLLNLTHWGRVTHICVVKLTIIGSDNGLSPGRRQAIIWTNAGILLIGPLGTNFIEILIGMQTFSFKKIHLKMSSAKWRPFGLGLNVLTGTYYLGAILVSWRRNNSQPQFSGCETSRGLLLSCLVACAPLSLTRPIKHRAALFLQAKHSTLFLGVFWDLFWHENAGH